MILLTYSKKIKTIKKLFFITLLLSLFANTFLFAQNLTITPGKTNITISEEFTLTTVAPYTKSLKIGDFPEIMDFSKKQTEFIRQDSTITIIQHYKPHKTGTFHLAPFHVWLNASKISYNKPITINVTAGKRTAPSEQSNANERFFKPELKASLIMEANKKSIFAGEGVTVTLNLLISEDNKADFNFIDLKTQIEKINSFLLPQNCIAENLSIPNQIPTDTVSINNTTFYRYNLYKQTFYPLGNKPLQFKKTSFTLLCYEEFRKQGLIDRKDHPVTLHTEGVSIKVKEVPADDKGNLLLPGQFILREKLSTTKVRLNKTFLYTFTITGDGNLAIAQAPIIKMRPEVEIYPKATPADAIGRKTFSYYIIPKKAGDLKLKDLFSWPYFNTRSAKIDTLKPIARVTVHSGEIPIDISYKKDPFYKKILTDSNKLTQVEPDKMLKLFTNLVILFMFAVTAVLIIKK